MTFLYSKVYSFIKVLNFCLYFLTFPYFAFNISTRFCRRLSYGIFESPGSMYGTSLSFIFVYCVIFPVLFSNSSVGYHWRDAAATYNWNSGLITPNNEWAMIAVSVGPTAATAYLCKSSGITSATNTTAHASLSGLNFYIAVDPANPTRRTFVGGIAIAMIYNEALSLDDITTNFNAQKSRFGL